MAMLPLLADLEEVRTLMTCDEMDIIIAKIRAITAQCEPEGLTKKVGRPRRATGG
jgi:hypothetical protein